MESLIAPGRWIFCAAFAAFGVEYLAFGRFLKGLPLIPDGTPGSPLLPRAIGAAVLAAALLVVLGKRARLAATLLGALLLLSALFLQAPSLALHLRDPARWTMLAEALSLAGGAWSLAALSPREELLGSAQDLLPAAGRVLFALPLAIIGVQHFQYANFVAALVPAWIPWPLFWTWFTGAALVASALAITLQLKATLAATLLALMLLLWVAVLHIPRIVGAAENVNEWTSGFVALAVGGAALAVAGATRSSAKP